MFRPTGIKLDPQNGEPLYRQIFDQVIDRIRSGAFPPGFRLPPTRTLAHELDAHRNTIVRAFEDLQSRGSSSRSSAAAPSSRRAAGRRGARAAADPRRMPWASLLSRAARAEPLGRADALARPAPHRDTINLSRMQPSDDLLPHELMRRCIDHVLRARGPAALGYAPREGLPKLRELIAEDLARHGVPARADDVLITTGSQQALDLVARALIDPGDTFLVDDATYTGAINLLAAAGARVMGVKSDDEGPDLESLERHARGGAKGFYLMPNCHNPTGSCVSARRREALVAWSHRAGVPLIEDDYGADLNLDGDPPPAALRALRATSSTWHLLEEADPGAAHRLHAVPRVAAQAPAAAQAHDGPRHLGAAAARAGRVPRARLPARAPAPHGARVPRAARRAGRGARRGTARRRRVDAAATRPGAVAPAAGVDGSGRGLRGGAPPGRAGDAGRALQRERPRSPRAAPHLLRREAGAARRRRAAVVPRVQGSGRGPLAGVRAVARPASLV